MRSSPNLGAHKVKVLSRLKAICSSISPIKGDEELCNSFDSFQTGEPVILESAEELRATNYFTILEEIIDVLHELEEHPMAEVGKSQPEDTSQVDSSNRLYASLKRHPE